MAEPTKADYGLDAPGVVVGNAAGGAAALAGAWVGWAALRRRHRVPAAVLGAWLALWGTVAVAQAGNDPAATMANARAEGVAERVELCGGDARRLPFGDQAFDVVVSSLALHNIAGATGRAAAIGEVVRVLRPGGRVAILDLRSTGQYAAALARPGSTTSTARGAASACTRRSGS